VQACVEEGRDFPAEFESAWDCYLPFMRHYGDALAVGFHSVPFFDQDKVTAFCLIALLYFICPPPCGSRGVD